MRNMPLWTVTYHNVLENSQTFRDILVGSDIYPPDLWTMRLDVLKYEPPYVRQLK